MTFKGTSRCQTLLLMLGFASLFCFTMAASTWGEAPAGSGADAKKIPFPMPNSHKGNWLQYHGASADLTMNEADSKGKACYVCHERNECMECHNTTMPKDHTNTWRTLSHGFQAEGNRDRCQNCHRQDYCVRCHNETAPRTHTANWRSRHCTWCHYGSSLAPDDNCVVCHKQALHTSAPLGHTISPTVTCIQVGCHQ
ncbi:MAG TPA: hypothetical protein DCS42_04995 [Nitrospiraceae bacterium]|jgi:hypothetical protein|nr:hypothetical protein [Nitrospiraceae bacterium]